MPFNAAFCAATNGTLARVTFDTYEVRFAAWLAWLEAEEDPSLGSPYARAYDAAATSAGTILAPVFSSVKTSVLALLTAMCAV